VDKRLVLCAIVGTLLGVILGVWLFPRTARVMDLQPTPPFNSISPTVKPKVVLEYSCEKKIKRFDTQGSADNFCKVLHDFGFKTEIHKNKPPYPLTYELPYNPNDMANLFHDGTTIHMWAVVYWANKQRREFTDKETADLWMLKLTEYGCEVENAIH